MHIAPVSLDLPIAHLFVISVYVIFPFLSLILALWFFNGDYSTASPIVALFPLKKPLTPNHFAGIAGLS